MFRRAHASMLCTHPTVSTADKISHQHLKHIEWIRARKKSMGRANTTPLATGAEKRAFPTDFSPMLLHAEKVPTTKAGWIYEPKLDGMRAIVLTSGGKCKLLSRNGRDISRVFPAITASMSAYKTAAIFDAEIIVPDNDGRPDFEALQARWLLTNTKLIQSKEAESPAQLYVFDLLHQGEHDLTNCDLTDRKQLLSELLIEKDNVRQVLTCKDGVALYQACKAQMLEGIVAKKADSKYRPGQRTKDWVKVKFTENGVFTVIGYRKNDGFLIAETSGKTLLPVGFVQYGFTDLNYRRMTEALKGASDPASDGLIRYEPTVKVNVEFMTRTKKGNLRFPVFKSFAQG